eukprot:6405566-Prymnesium_polylepis.1
MENGPRTILPPAWRCHTSEHSIPERSCRTIAHPNHCRPPARDVISRCWEASVPVLRSGLVLVPLHGLGACHTRHGVYSTQTS